MDVNSSMKTKIIIKQIKTINHDENVRESQRRPQTTVLSVFGLQVKNPVKLLNIISFNLIFVFWSFY